MPMLSLAWLANSLASTISSPTTTQLIMRFRSAASTWRCQPGFSNQTSSCEPAGERDQVGASIVVQVGDHHLVAALQIARDGVFDEGRRSRGATGEA